MRRKCVTCQKIYDDEVSWTSCPHNPLDVGTYAPYCKQHDLFNCYLCDHSGYFDYREQLGEYQCPLERQLHELHCWKQNMLEVEAQFDAHGLAKMLGATIGESARGVIQRQVPRLLQRCKDLEEENRELREQRQRFTDDMIKISNIAAVRILADQP